MKATCAALGILGFGRHHYFNTGMVKTVLSNIIPLVKLLINKAAAKKKSKKRKAAPAQKSGSEQGIEGKNRRP
jgi:hypothetical protein